MKRSAAFLLSLLLLTAGCSRPEKTVQVIHRSGAGDVAVPVELEPIEGAGTESVVRARTASGETLLLQRTPALLHSASAAPDPTYCAVLPGASSQEGAEGSTFSFAEGEGTLQLREDGRPVLTYNYGMQLPPGVPEQYRRSTYVHPVWDLSGNMLTDDFPEDHYHHRGLSWMWPRVVVGGAAYDLWHLQGVRQVFQEWLAREEGPVCATIGARNAWQLADGEKIMDEWVWIRTYRASERGRALDVHLTLEAADRPVELLGQENQNKGYGGLSFRLAPREGTVITTPEGVQAEDSDDERPVWADESGRFGGSDRFSGVAIFQHEANPNFPAAWTLRHYGFLGVSWPGNRGTTLVPGEPVTLRYRLWIHEGDAERGQVAEAYRGFAEPPMVQMVE